jgi:hypothetical protein
MRQTDLSAISIHRTVARKTFGTITKVHHTKPKPNRLHKFPLTWCMKPFVMGEITPQGVVRLYTRSYGNQILGGLRAAFLFSARKRLRGHT